jgi:hypothetical protein
MNKNDALISLSESGKVPVLTDNFDNESFPHKVFCAVWWLEAEVNNGGFSQYFLNSSNESAKFVCEALRTIGASETAAICERAIAVAFPKGLPANPEDISAAAVDFPEATEANLEALDAEFFEYPCDLTELLYAFVMQHPKEFPIDSLS